MSSPLVSSYPALLNPTRQQLDELDSLIQRMLDLPANQLDEEFLLGHAGAPGHESSVLGATISPERQNAKRGEINKLATNSSYAAWQKSKEVSSLTLLPEIPVNASVGGEAEIVTVPCDPQEPPTDHREIPEAARDESLSRTYSAVDADQLPIEAQGEVETVESAKSSQDVFASFTMSEARPEKGLPGLYESQRRTGRISLLTACLLPLYWTNAAFDECCALMGPFGRAARSIYGRSFIGFIGLTLFAIALGWFLIDWMGWTWLSAFAKIIH